MSSFIPQTPGTPKSGQAQVAAGPAAAPLSATSQFVRTVSVEAAQGNVASIWIGPSTVTTGTGYEMVQMATLTFENVDLNTVYINGTGVGDKAYWFAIV